VPQPERVGPVTENHYQRRITFPGAWRPRRIHAGSTLVPDLDIDGGIGRAGRHRERAPQRAARGDDQDSGQHGTGSLATPGTVHRGVSGGVDHRRTGAMGGATGNQRGFDPNVDREHQR
jgi:hypothetical protein